MKRLICLGSFCFCILLILADSSSGILFKMMDYADAQIVPNVEYTNTTDIPINNVGCLSGLSISGKSILNSDTSLVRVVLIDSQRNTYLVYEDNPVIHTNDDFQNIAFETVYLDSIMPQKLHIVIRNARLQLNTINYIYCNERQLRLKRKDALINRRNAQEEYFINKWNEYNATHRNYWVAGKTSLSNMTYSQKKVALGASDDSFVTDGIEYYIGGFFVVKSRNESAGEPLRSEVEMQTDANYVDSFDWRNRHGKDWMTPLKNQTQPQNTTGNGGCWAFGTCAAVESAVNLQFNQLLNYDLSEQEIGSCTSGSLHSGGSPATALLYMKNYGVTTEECMPFENTDTIDCSKKCENPNDVVQITNYRYINPTDANLKDALINNGPIASGFSNGYTNHEMCLCGYGTVKVGDSIELVPYTSQGNIKIKIAAGNELIGKTYWIYKNSYGSSNNFDGYLYAVYEQASTRKYTYAITYPVQSEVYSQTDVVCEDNDGDGYYFWGLGTKPAHCPICCPNSPDGDDSNSQLAQMDVYGNFTPYSFPYDTIFINKHTIWNTNDTICGNIVIKNGANLTISSSITLNPAAKIFIGEESTLIVNGGNIINSDVIVGHNGNLILRNNAILLQNNGDNMQVKKGGKLLIEEGNILVNK